MASGGEVHPLVEFKPPVLEPLAYLCLVEHELTADDKDPVASLAVLNSLLQDESLAQLIGWDLVTLLTPLLPAAEDCMRTIFALGNAKEVVLRAAVALQLLFGNANDDNDEDDAFTDRQSQDSLLENIHAIHCVSPNRKAVQFSTLVKLLPSVLKRLKVRRPSLFIASIMQSIVRALNLASQSLDFADLRIMYDAYLHLLAAIPTDGKPSLPPRGASSSIRHGPLPRPALDRTKGTSTEETEIHIRLIQASIVSAFYIYLLASSSSPPVSDFDLGWAGRVKELFDPDTMLPSVNQRRTAFGHTQALNQLFIKDSGLVAQDEDVQVLVALSFEHGITSEDLLYATMNERPMDTWDFDTDEPPSSVDDMPFPQAAAILLLAARNTYRCFHASKFSPEDLIMDLTYINKSSVITELAGRPDPGQSEPTIQIFPHHAAMTRVLLAEIDALPPSQVIDALLALGLAAVHNGQSIEAAADDDAFRIFCRDIGRISACSSSPQLRYIAHLLVSKVLHSHPQDIVRLAFIRNLLAECPWDNLCESAVGWFKAETLAVDCEKDSGSPFANGEALRDIAPIIFPNLNDEWTELSTETKMEKIMEKAGTLLASLNFYHFLVLARPRQKALKFPALHLGTIKVAGIQSRFLLPLIETLTDARTKHSDQLPLEIEMVLTMAETVSAAAKDMQATGSALDQMPET